MTKVLEIGHPKLYVAIHFSGLQAQLLTQARKNTDFVMLMAVLSILKRPTSFSSELLLLE